MVIISSFYNEEYLLPWWLTHHKSMFKHGVLFDYFSTDRSVGIIKEICPEWEVRPTKNKDWDPRTNDEEFMEVEREHKGYKMTLTTTEFLVGDIAIMNPDPTVLEIPIVRMVDTNPNDVPTHDKSLLEQKKYGFLDKSSRKRFIHNLSDGAYATGRDRTSHSATKSSLRVVKYVYCPWTEDFINRRLQMKEHMSKEHLSSKSWGKQHKLDREKLQKEYEKVLSSKLEEII